MYIFYERMRNECLKLGVEIGLEPSADGSWSPFVVIALGHIYFSWSLEKGKR